MLDGILFEKNGIPSLPIITEPFIETAIAMAKAWGVPDYGFFSIPHPIANLNESELEKVAEDAASNIVNLLQNEKQV